MSYSKSFFILDKVETPKNKERKDGEIDISVVTPTEAAVEQAKCVLEQEKNYK